MSVTAIAPAADADHFRSVLGQFCTGVVVVTAQDEDAAPIGMAVGSFASVSLSPQLVAFFVAHTSTTFPKIAATGRFCANILARDQHALCRQFAQSGGDKFSGVEWRPSAGGSPILEGTHGWVDCAIDSVQRFGDHDLVIGRVEQLAAGDGAASPLVFYRSGFHALGGAAQ